MDDKRLEKAAIWHARLHSDTATEADWIGFTEWLDADEKNHLAYDRIEDLDIELADKREVIAASLEVGSAKSKSTVIDAAWRWSRPRKWAAAAATAAAVLFMFASMGPFSGDPSFAGEFVTGVGEERLVALNDGTNVRLNTDSRIVVTLDEGERRTRLEYGEALFDVAKDEKRPFVVMVGDRNVRVVGTVFNILRHEGTVTITVAEGIVEVSPDQLTATNQALEIKDRLTRGQQLVHQEGAVENDIQLVDASVVTSWKSGHLAYENVALKQIISDLNRYFPTKVRLESTGTEALTFSGALKTDDQAAALALLEDLLPVVIEKKDDAIIMRPQK